MRTPRALIAANPLQFGRGQARLFEEPSEERWSLSDDARLFATTFTAGFLFVAILIG